MVLKCAVKLRLFDAIHRHSAGDRPISLPELAASLPVPPNRLSVLRRLMRYLAHLRLVDVRRNDDGDDSYTLTTASSVYLREGSERTHAAYVKFFIEEDMLAALHTLDASLAGGEEAAAAAAGKESIFEWMARDTGAVLKGCPEVFRGVSVLVDVGGGAGVEAAAIARAFSGIRCVVYDLPHVVEEAPKWEAVEYEAGDMFVSVPNADALLFLAVGTGMGKSLGAFLCSETFFVHKDLPARCSSVPKEIPTNSMLQPRSDLKRKIMDMNGRGVNKLALTDDSLIRDGEVSGVVGLSTQWAPLQEDGSERVLHVFDDEKALRILKRCKEAFFEDKGKLIIIDEVINEADAKELLHVKLAYDMILMQYTGGKERTKSEWRSLLLKAGFTRCRITRVMALQHIIEARR
ncbi:Isoflavone 4'-O-methyltransferase [Platanthera zijinensis]|uniref:Isoflavone 4'-O-methyltransferase n=1 Tax=Platanthera zijinensis TaxID=2320716 RepID=A0AAP0G6U2_9ASPA